MYVDYANDHTTILDRNGDVDPYQEVKNGERIVSNFEQGWIEGRKTSSYKEREWIVQFNIMRSSVSCVWNETKLVRSDLADTANLSSTGSTTARTYIIVVDPIHFH